MTSITATSTANRHAENQNGEGPLSILHIADHVRNVGNGIVNVTVDLACAQADAGHHVAIASAGGDYEPLLAEHGVAHHRLLREDTLSGRARVVARLHSIVRAEAPEVVNAHRAFATVAARLVKPLHRFALVATDHNQFESKGRWLKLADRIIAVSDGAASSLAVSGIPRERIRVVPNGPIGGARRSLVPDVGDVPLARPAVVTVAGLLERKGVHVLLEAFERIAPAEADAHLYYVGEGPERPVLADRARRSGLAERVHLEGFQADPSRYLRAADVFVLPSYCESFGLAAVEARIAGAPVVVSDAEGLPEAVDRGQAGLLVPTGDAAALAATLRSLLASPDERARWSERARTGLERFGADRMARETEVVYRQLLGSRKR
ncbi:MAG: glycosyltransferase family 4 protein [Solirubrobacteraceae bacterium]